MLLHVYAMENVVHNIHIRQLMIKPKVHLKLQRKKIFKMMFFFEKYRSSIRFNNVCFLDEE
jgi:hypothetical protein